ncbi:MAG: 16S rRNA (cytosine(1402)-N(4))-methyltransferase [Pilosibacter sp.]
MSLMRRRSHGRSQKRNRKRQYIETTTELKEVIEQVLFIPEKKSGRGSAKKSCQRMFPGAEDRCQPGNSRFWKASSLKTAGDPAPGGRAAILTFRSGEDRLVKYYFKDGKKEGISTATLRDDVDPHDPSAAECQRNPRARSTKMRWAIRDGENPLQDVKKNRLGNGTWK